MPHVKTSGAGSLRRLSYAGACIGLRTGCICMHGRPRETAQHQRPRWVADLRNTTARDHLWHPAARSVYTNASSAVVHLITSLRSSHLVGDHLFDFGATAAAYACSLCQERVFPSCPDFGSAPRAHADREHRWRHIEHLLFECPGILGTGGTLAVTLLRDDLLKACFGSDHASAVLLAALPSDRTPVVAATACLVPFLLDTAAALGRPPHWRMTLQCLALVAAFLLSVSSVACTRLPPSESVLASLRLPASSSIHSWWLCLRSGSLSAPALLPAPTPVFQVSTPVRRGAVADARLGLA